MSDLGSQDFKEQIEPIVKRKWMIIIPAILGTVISAAIAYNLPKSYHSKTLIIVEQQQVPEQYVTPTEATPVGQRLNTIRQQIMSRTNLEKIIENFNLYKNDNEGPVDRLFLRYGIAKKSVPGKEQRVEKMRRDIEVTVIGGSHNGGGDAFSISYTGKDPYTTMEVTNRLASMFINENLKIREQSVEGTSEFINSELESAKMDLEKQEKALREFKERHMGALPNQIDANLRTLDRLQLELQSVRENIKNSLDRKMLLEEQLTAVSDSAAPYETNLYQLKGPLTSQLKKLRNELDALRSVYKDNYPDVIIARKRIKEIEKKLTSEPEKNDFTDIQVSWRDDRTDRFSQIYAELKTLDSQIDIMKKRENRIKDQIGLYEKRVEDTPANEQLLADIRRDYEISLQNYQSLLEKKLNARLAENLEKRQKGERFRVIDPANLPESPYKPDVRKIMLLGLVVGAGIGIGLVFLREYTNPVFRKNEDFDGIFPQPVLAAIPKYSAKTTLSDFKKGKKLKIIRGGKA